MMIGFCFVYTMSLVWLDAWIYNCLLQLEYHFGTVLCWVFRMPSHIYTMSSACAALYDSCDSLYDSCDSLTAALLMLFISDTQTTIGSRSYHTPIPSSEPWLVNPPKNKLSLIFLCMMMSSIIILFISSLWTNLHCLMDWDSCLGSRAWAGGRHLWRGLLGTPPGPLVLVWRSARGWGAVDSSAAAAP